MSFGRHAPQSVNALVLMQCAYWAAANLISRGTCMPITRSNEKKGTYRREVGQVPSANNPGWPQQVITEARLQVRRSLGQRVKMVEGSGPTRGLKCLIRPVVIGYGKVISPSPFLSLKRVVVRVIQRVLLLLGQERRHRQGETTASVVTERPSLRQVLVV